jgi:hypothetical protein
METHSSVLYLWFEGDAEKREFDLELKIDTNSNKSALEIGAERNAEIMAEVLKRVRWSISLANVKCGGTAAQDSQSEANEGAYPPLPRTT